MSSDKRVKFSLHNGLLVQHVESDAKNEVATVWHKHFSTKEGPIVKDGLYFLYSLLVILVAPLFLDKEILAHNLARYVFFFFFFLSF